MQIVAYFNSRAPEGYQAAARVLVRGLGKKGGLEPLPVTFHASDVATARAAAETWFSAELEAYRSRNTPGRKGRLKASALEGVVDPATLPPA